VSDLVRKEGLEPTCLSALEPKSSASTNSATFAVAELYPKEDAADFPAARRRARYNPENSSASAPLPVNHYENFPVASWLVPARLRPPIEAIYAFARSADDVADEGDFAPAERLARLDVFLRALDEIEAGARPAEPMFRRVADAVATWHLPASLFRDLIDAFRQDVTTTRYATFDDLLDYSRRSANPVGRLVLHVFGEKMVSESNFRRSDAICSALQLTNFWQDVAVDWQKGRVYIPQEDLGRFGVKEGDIAAGRADARWQALMAFECERARSMLLSGKPLGAALPGRLGVEIRATIHGGATILDKIDAVSGDVFRNRPVLGAFDWMAILAKSLAP
jgi:squalene synthase HpnC